DRRRRKCALSPCGKGRLGLATPRLDEGCGAPPHPNVRVRTPALPSPTRGEDSIMSAELPRALAGQSREAQHAATMPPPHGSALARFLKATELDTRVLGMIAALAAIWIALHILSGGLFLTPRNLWNLSVQSSPVAIMATGMVLVIVTRNIDLSIGS